MMPYRRHCGFSLIELIMAIVIIGIAVGVIAQLFSQNVAGSPEPFLRQRTIAVANAFMDEILHKKWDHVTPDGGGCVNTGSAICPTGPLPSGIGTEAPETRATYNDIDDYNEINNQSPPRDASDNPMPGYIGFTVDVTVTQPAANWNGIDARDVRLIQVDVTSPLNETITLQAYRVNF